MKKLLAVVFVFFLAAVLAADEKETILEVKGTGISRSEAIQDALVEAIKQVKGVSIDSKKAFVKEIQKKSVSYNDESSHNVEVGSLSQNLVKEVTKGVIDEYRIIDERKLGAGEWEVELAVKILNYKSPGASNENRYKIAVMPFYVSQNSFIIGSKRYSGAKISDIVSQTLTTNITQSRKFAVVDRTYIRDISKELNLIDSEQVPLSEKVKLGQKLGADYLLVGTIQRADMQTQNLRNQSTGESSSKNIAEFIIDYRVIVVGSSQIKWSDTAKAVFEISNANASDDMVLQDAVEKVSVNITNTLLGNIYPIRIAQITKNGDIVLNQGGNSIEQGMRLDVMQIGEKIIDPYTNESLGNTESKIAEIEITRVTPKLSYAKVVDGDFASVKKNDICRRQSNTTSEQKDNENWRKTDIKAGEGGGVRLPFD